MDESLITAQLQEMVGVEGPAVTKVITPELAQRLRETVEGVGVTFSSALSRQAGIALPSPGDAAPWYSLLVCGAGASLPETPGATEGLVTGDDWTLIRPPLVGETVTATARLDSVHERFGSRFGHNLVLRTAATVTGEDGRVIGEAGLTMIRFRAPEPGAMGRLDTPTPPTARNGGHGEQPEHEQMRAFWEAATPFDLRRVRVGDRLPPRTVFPSLHMVVRYCGLAWAYVPFFFDAAAARRAGLPGAIVPGPLKLALFTHYLTELAGDGGRLRMVRCAHRRPDQSGHPLLLCGAVTRVEADEDGNLVECELWSETEAGERSVLASATFAIP